MVHYIPLSNLGKTLMYAESSLTWLILFFSSLYLSNKTILMYLHNALWILLSKWVDFVPNLTTLRVFFKVPIFFKVCCRKGVMQSFKTRSVFVWTLIKGTKCDKYLSKLICVCYVMTHRVIWVFKQWNTDLCLLGH